ncbi:hypothetical protein Rhow_004490 [Rhodococcus wratislaviensis]|uniref:Integrase n=1 Tax=Rhodococcus wratislaviensis TaxID=44752 RepID=A0A402CBI6_RHOWR|nr:hypothetical protein Rhow_004490 [Rhodococcus wratislaviensis]
MLQARTLREGIDLADTSRYGDDVWVLDPAQTQSHYKALILNFIALPESYRPVAKQMYFAMLSGELPPGEKRPEIVTIRGSMIEVKRFFGWLTQHFGDQSPPPPLTALTTTDLQQYRHHLTKTRRPALVAVSCAGVRYLWRYRHVLDDHLSFDPVRAIDGWSIPHRLKEAENRTDRIPEQVLGPLITWSLRFIDDFAPDIVAAHQIWLRHRNQPRRAHTNTGARAALNELLNDYIDRGRPLPGRNGALHLKYLARLAGVSLTTVHAGSDAIAHAVELVGICESSTFDLDIAGTLEGRPWIDAISTSHITHDGLATLARMLHNSCYIIVSYLSGMRDSEIKHLSRGCIRTRRDPDGNIYRWTIHSTAFKGEPTEGAPATWTVSATVARAVTVLEQIQPPSQDLLFAALPHSPGGKTPVGRALPTGSTLRQLNDFRDWINAYCTRTGRIDAIPDVDGQPWKFRTSQFRRTLAWFIARRPGGSIAGAIQYRHMSIQMFEGYAGTSDSGFRAEVEAEMALARGEHLLTVVEAHKHTDFSGPAAEEAAHRLTEFGAQANFAGVIVTDPRRLSRLMNKHDPAIYPGTYANCVFNPDKALCTRTHNSHGTPQPTLTDCKPLDCRNVALTEDNLTALTEELTTLLGELDARPPLPPLLHQRLTTRAETLTTFIARHDRTHE